MSFTEFRFYLAAICLVALLVLIQWMFRKREGTSNLLSKLLLLAFSYFVMALYDWRFCACITGVILLAYLAGLGVERAQGRARRAVTAAAVAMLIAVLGIFKYLNFFLSAAMGIIGRPWTNLNILLPLGISFYIFSAIGYVLDVNWGKIRAERSLLDMALFLAFFPKQVCGPIVNARDFLPQLKENRRVNLKDLEAGVQIFLFGFIKKLVLADHLAVFVDDVFAATPAYGTATIWLAVFSYFLQLYFDFSGYSDMAIGMSRMLGYELRRNFNLPFLARNISEFWDRWHISLSTWLNEYLFNPIALKFKRIVADWPKERRKRWKNLPTYAALLITFLVSGLWHGAGYTFLVWGLLHGLYSILHAAWAGWRKRRRRGAVRGEGKFAIALSILANYFVLTLIQVFFRANSLGHAAYIFRRMFAFRIGVEQPYTWAFFAAAVLLAATLVAVRRARKQGMRQVEGYYPQVSLDTVRGLTLFFTMCGLALMLAYFGETYFIYGNF